MTVNMKVPTKVMRLKKYFVDTFTKKVIIKNPLKYKGLFLMHLGVIAVFFIARRKNS